MERYRVPSQSSHQERLGYPTQKPVALLERILSASSKPGDVVDRERAKIGIYISLEPHTQPMEKEAAGAGLYDGPTGKVPKIQLFTIEELFAGQKPKIPLIERGFKAAAREERDDQSELDI